MKTKFTAVLYLVIFFLMLILLTLDPLLYGGFTTNIEQDLFELQVRSNPVRTQGIVTREIDRWPKDGKYWFEVEYNVDGKQYQAFYSTQDEIEANMHRLDARSRPGYENQGLIYEPYGTPIYILYYKKNPSRHIVGEFIGAAPLSFGSRSIPLSMVVYFAAIIYVLFCIVNIIYSLIKYPSDKDKEDMRDWLTKAEAEAFIGKNSEYYLSKWKDQSESFFKGWNWAAAFFCVEWFAYRKMYGRSVSMLPGFWIGIVPRFVPVAVFLYLGFSQFLSSWLAVTISILIARFIGGGIFGNIYHRDTALKMLNETLKMSEPERLEYLKSKGGTNVFAPVVAIIIQSLIIAALILPLCGV